jgi:hypothetical protein
MLSHGQGLMGETQHILDDIISLLEGGPQAQMVEPVDKPAVAQGLFGVATRMQEQAEMAHRVAGRIRELLGGRQ